MCVVQTDLHVKPFKRYRLANRPVTDLNARECARSLHRPNALGDIRLRADDGSGRAFPRCIASSCRQNTCQTQNCNVNVVSDTGPTGTPNPFVAGVVQREVTYQAVDSSGKAVKGAEISLHETPLPGKEGGDAKNYSYARDGSSNSQKGLRRRIRRDRSLCPPVGARRSPFDPWGGPAHGSADDRTMFIGEACSLAQDSTISMRHSIAPKRPRVICRCRRFCSCQSTQ